MSATLGAAARRRLVPYYDVHGPWSSMLVGNRNGGKASGKIWREGQLSDDGEFVDGQTIGQLTGEFVDRQTMFHRNNGGSGTPTSSPNVPCHLNKTTYLLIVLNDALLWLIRCR